jgi:hypothetical protein
MFLKCNICLLTTICPYVVCFVTTCVLHNCCQAGSETLAFQILVKVYGTRHLRYKVPLATESHHATDQDGSDDTCPYQHAGSRLYVRPRWFGFVR